MSLNVFNKVSFHLSFTVLFTVDYSKKIGLVSGFTVFNQKKYFDLLKKQKHKSFFINSYNSTYSHCTGLSPFFINYSKYVPVYASSDSSFGNYLQFND